MTYTDFLGANHAASGHWNDAPKSILLKKNQNKDINSEIQYTQFECYTKLTQLINSIDINSLSIMEKNKIRDINMRLEAFKNSKEVSNEVLMMLSNIIHKLMEKEFKAALDLHAKVLLQADGIHTRWLVGVKRIIEVLKIQV
ncbi:hypothetical protein K502DRAFT_325630 [Neoconidiobolus thromboides FSU 785]|nr:hypothetical protein K502DRAFT_325630 [Neoconidiobolus thromboides FSU 785]